jgi:YVTN family beta-propeller protein
MWACGGVMLAMLAAVPAASAAVFPYPTTSSPIALSRNDRLVFVVNPRDDTLSVLCAANGNVVATIGVGDEPRSVAVDPNNDFIFVANAADSSVTVIRIINATCGGWAAALDRTIKTGAEPWNIVISPDGQRIFVANSGQDTITVINAVNRTKIGDVNLRDSLCNDPDRNRHFQPRGMAVSQDSSVLYVTRFLSFTIPVFGRQGRDNGKEGIVCRFNINTNSNNIGGYQPAEVISFLSRVTGFNVDSNGDGVPDPTRAWPNQLQSFVLRGNRGFMPNIAASPESPLVFNVDTQAFVTILRGVGTNNQRDGGSLNLHLGARNPEPGKKRLFFSNPWAIAFTTQSGNGNAYVVSAGSDLLVKLDVNAANELSFTVDADTTRYIDLNDPDDPETAGSNAGKNPQGIVINSEGTTAWVTNFVSGNVSVVNLNQDKVVDVIQTALLPPSGSLEERVLVGAEMFFSSRGHFNRPGGTNVSTDERLSSEGWQNCASCHFNGWTDGVVWAFGSGPRKSVNLAGSFNPQDRNEQKILNYSGIFDEIQDFELNIRNVSGPGAGPLLPCQSPPPDESTFDRNHGLLIGDKGNINRAPCVINAFVKPNAGREEVTVDPVGATAEVEALTALKLWVQRAVRVANGPLNSNQIAGGVPVGDIQEGRQLFNQQQCQSCHSGGLWSKSVKNFTSPPANKQIACEVDLGVAAPPGSFCTTAPVFGDPINVQYLRRFIEDVGSFNLGVPGGGNPIGDNIGAEEKAAKALVAGVSQVPKDGLGLDYNEDGFGEGFSPQSLLGVHAVQPYMHNGACETLACVVGDVDHRTANGTLPDVLDTAAKRRKVVQFLESIDADTAPFD